MWQAFIINILYDLQILVERQVHKSNPTTNTNPENPSPQLSPDPKKTTFHLQKLHHPCFYQCHHHHPIPMLKITHPYHPCGLGVEVHLLDPEETHPCEVIQCQWPMSIDFMDRLHCLGSGLRLHPTGVETLKLANWVEVQIQGQKMKMRFKDTAANPKSILYTIIIRYRIPTQKVLNINSVRWFWY